MKLQMHMIAGRGGTVHRCHGSVRTSVRYDFGTTGKKENKSTMLGFFSFILNRQ